MTDMTNGSPFKLLLKFSLPMLLSVAFQQLYNVVDTVVAGRFISSDALAAVGASFPVTMLFMAVATGCNIGCSVVISQLFGAKKFKAMKTAVSTSIFATLGLSVILTAAGLAFSPLLMRALKTDAKIFADCEIYLNVYILGLAFLFLYNICNGVFVALGDSKTPLFFLIFSSFSNIILDIVFVVNLGLGVFGIALATFLCQGAASLLSLTTLLFKLKKIKTEKFKLFSKEMLGKISLVAIPSIIQQSFISVGNLFIQGLVNGFGTDVTAGYAAAVKLNTFGIMCFSTLGNALSSFTAQNIGAGKHERVKLGFKSGLIMTICVVVPISIINFVFSPQLIWLFVGDEAAVIQHGTLFLQIISPFYVVVSIKLLIDGILRGASAMKEFMIATFSDLILRVVFAYIFTIFFINSPLGIWLGWPIGWIIATIVSCFFYKKGVWNKQRL